MPLSNLWGIGMQGGRGSPFICTALLSLNFEVLQDGIRVEDIKTRGSTFSTNKDEHNNVLVIFQTSFILIVIRHAHTQAHVHMCMAPHIYAHEFPSLQNGIRVEVIKTRGSKFSTKKD